MRLSDKKNRIYSLSLTLGVPLLLMVPNFMLSLQGEMSPLPFLANLILPAALLTLLLTVHGKPALMTLLTTPLMFLAGFQTVLLFLYSDGSIIGVDMFLNLTTTNPGEASELLINLKSAIITVLMLYIPPIIAAGAGMRLKVRLLNPLKTKIRKIAAAAAGAGVLAIILAKAFTPGYVINERLYPYNVFYNLGLAAERTVESANYPDTSKGFTYEARSTRPEVEREVYVAVIGETSRAGNWQLCGYDRATNPRLSQTDSLLVYPRTLSESNTTHKSVPLLLTPLTSKEYADELNSTRPILAAFKEAGFHTAYVSMQLRNGSYIDYFANEADQVHFLREPGGKYSGTYDIDLLIPLDSIIAANRGKLLIVLHQYGSHFNYFDRVPDCDRVFNPSQVTDATAANRAELINAYDNTICHTDRLLASVIHRLDSLECPAGLIYTSDHGEDIFDDSRNRFLHASPTPTFEQLHVPLLLYFNDSLRAIEPDLYRAAAAHRSFNVSSSETFTPTLTHMAGVASPKVNEAHALTSPDFRPVKERRFLSDRNKSLPLRDAGFRHQDFEKLERLNAD